MEQSITGYPPDGIEAVSKRLGVDFATLLPKRSPDDLIRKISILVLSGALLAAPFVWARVYTSDVFSFSVTALLSLLLIDIVGWGITRITLYDYHSKWKAAAKGIAAGNAIAACEAVRDTLYYFRILVKWRRHMKHTSIWTELAFLLSISYALLATLNLPSADWNFFGGLAPYALAYFLIAYAARVALLQKLLAITDDLDPTIQICWALAEVHKKYNDCASSK